MPEPKYPSFDYTKAWIEYALPRFKKYILPSVPWQNCIANYLSLYTKSPDLFRQAKDLDIPLAPVASVLEPIRLLDPMLLSLGARIIHDYSHWNPGHLACQAHGLLDERNYLGNGAGWHITNLIDQHLCKELAIPRNRTTKTTPYRSISIYDGYIRRCFSGLNFWVWEEMGPACPLTLNTLNSPITIEITSNDSYSRCMAELAAYKKACASALAPYLDGDLLPFNINPYMAVWDLYEREQEYKAILAAHRDPGPFTPAD